MVASDNEKQKQDTKASDIQPGKDKQTADRELKGFRQFQGW